MKGTPQGVSAHQLSSKFSFSTKDLTPYPKKIFFNFYKKVFKGGWPNKVCSYI